MTEPNARETHKRLTDHYAATAPQTQTRTAAEEVAALESIGQNVSPNLRMQLGYARAGQENEQ